MRHRLQRVVCCFAGHSPSLQVLGISTVVGNQTVEKVTNNALRMLRAAGLEHIGEGHQGSGLGGGGYIWVRRQPGTHLGPGDALQLPNV